MVFGIIRITFLRKGMERITSEKLKGLNERKLIYAPYPLSAERADTVSLEVEINPKGEVIQIRDMEAITPTYRSTSLLKHRAAQAVMRWRFEPATSSNTQWVRFKVPVDGRRRR